MATVLTKLPFITPPQIESAIVGNPTVGEIEIPKYYSLTDEEEKFIDSMGHLLPDEPYKLAIGFASEIAESLKKPIKETAVALMDGDYDFYKGNFDKIFAYNDQATKSRQNREAISSKIMATAIIRGRLVDDWTFEDTCNPEKIMPGLVKKIAEFGLKERDGWDEQESVESVEEEEETTAE